MTAAFAPIAAHGMLGIMGRGEIELAVDPA